MIPFGQFVRKNTQILTRLPCRCTCLLRECEQHSWERWGVDFCSTVFPGDFGVTCIRCATMDATDVTQTSCTIFVGERCGL